MSTLVVVAAVDHSFDANVAALLEKAEHGIRADTSMGGHPSAAFIRAYHRYPGFDSYLFLQDSIKPVIWDIVAPFRAMAEARDVGVVAWAEFPLFIWDGPDQLAWVVDQYPEDTAPPFGIFGPIFYATREAMEKAEMFFPRTPRNRLEAQGTERAWAFTFAAAAVPMASLGHWNNDRLAHHDPIFRKTFALRPDVA